MQRTPRGRASPVPDPGPGGEASLQRERRSGRRAARRGKSAIAEDGAHRNKTASQGPRGEARDDSWRTGTRAAQRERGQEREGGCVQPGPRVGAEGETAECGGTHVPHEREPLKKKETRYPVPFPALALVIRENRALARGVDARAVGILSSSLSWAFLHHEGGRMRGQGHDDHGLSSALQRKPFTIAARAAKVREVLDVGWDLPVSDPFSGPISY